MALLASGLFFALFICGVAFVASSGSSSKRELGAESMPLNDAFVSSYEIVNTFEHDTSAFTQGLTFDSKGNLYESDGLYGKSAVRSVDVLSGKTKHKTVNERFHFGEGLEVVGDRLLQLTWKEHIYHEYKLPSLEKSGSHQLPCYPQCKEGWGLAYDQASSKLYLTDSTDKLFTLDPLTLKPQGPPMTIFDKRLGRVVNGVNELEWVEGEVSSARAARPRSCAPRSCARHARVRGSVIISFECAHTHAFARRARMRSLAAANMPSLGQTRLLT